MSDQSQSAEAHKRKRRRSKKQKTEVEVESFDVRVNRTNKKKKFDELDEIQSQSNITPHSDLPTTEVETSETTEIAQDLDVKPGDVSPKFQDLKNSTQEMVRRQKLGNTPVQPDPEAAPGDKKASKPKISKREKPSKRAFFDDDADGDEDEDEDQFGRAHIPEHIIAEKAESLLSVRQNLPIYQHKEKITEYINRNQVTVIIGETGSGKSTQIPQFLMPLNKKRIAVTQPRRVAAASLAARVSEEFGCNLGQEIGYQVRFSNITSHKTKVNYLTDGMLIRELMLDSSLRKYSTVIIDEAHERTVLTDLILGFLKQILVSGLRPDLKVVVMSATLNAELFSKFFDHAPILFVEGKMYNVTRSYLSEAPEDIVDTTIKAVVQVNSLEQEGDILCFLPGQEEIDNCVQILTTVAPQLSKDAPLIVPLPLYAALSPAQQLKIFQKLKGRKRKIILATNIAETSVTVPGVKYVIDLGLRKVKVWKHQLGLSTLLTTPISQASATQRAGRAGRESEGKVFRLYSENLFVTKLPKAQEPEILRNDIILPILTLKRMDVHDLLNWTWLEHPGREAILSALNTLYTLGALNDAGKVTALGYKMAVLPLPPALSTVLISALDYGVVLDVVDIVSCLSVDNLVLNVAGNNELRDEINYKRRQYTPLGNSSGDLIALKEYFVYFNKLHQQGSTVELKMWCKDLFLSYRAFRNVLRVRHQLIEYLSTSIRQDDSLTKKEQQTQLNLLNTQLKVDTSGDVESDSEDFEDLSQSLNIANILKSFLKGYVLNTAIGMPDRSYRTCGTGQLISIHPSSLLYGKSNMDAVMYIEYVYTAKAYGRTCSVIEPAWLQEVAPHLLGGARTAIQDN